MAYKKEVILLKELVSKLTAVIETQAVLRDSMADTRKCLRHILDRLDNMEATSEVMQLSLRRKLDVDALGMLDKKIIDIERRFSQVNPVREY